MLQRTNSCSQGVGRLRIDYGPDRWVRQL